MKTYECDQCGACCAYPIIEINYVDVLREPKLREVCNPFRIPEGMRLSDEDDEPIEITDPFQAGALLASGQCDPCPLLGADKRCTIYPTRPGCCVAFEAGSRLCQEAREAHGLPPLEPIPGESREA